MKKILILPLILFLGACATVPNPITNNTLGGIIDSYGVAQSALIAYRGLPRCTTSNNFSLSHICYKRSVLVQAQAYEKTTGDAINRAVRFQRDNPTVSANNYIAAAQAALSTFQSFENVNGVH